VDWFLVCARLALTSVFAVAAVGKLLDREGSAASLAEFGVPDRLIGAGSIGVPAAELLAALALLLAPTAQAGAIAALVLLAAFSWAILPTIRRGEKTECHCFGALHSEPVGGGLLVRNAVLAVIAVGVASQVTQPAIDGWMARRSADDLAILALSTAVAVATAVAGVLWRQNRALRKPVLAPLPSQPRRAGSPAPTFRLENVAGAQVTLRSLLRGSSPIALIFVSPGCGSCADLLSDLPRWQAPLSRDLPIHVVSAAGRDQARTMAADYQLDRVLIDPHSVVASRYGISGTPAALIIGADGNVASAPARGLPAIEALIRQTLAKQQTIHNYELRTPGYSY
jgi:hypothetical protein